MSINVKTADVILNNSFPYRRRQKSRPAPIAAKKTRKNSFPFLPPSPLRLRLPLQRAEALREGRAVADRGRGPQMIV